MCARQALCQFSDIPSPELSYVPDLLHLASRLQGLPSPRSLQGGGSESCGYGGLQSTMQPKASGPAQALVSRQPHEVTLDPRVLGFCVTPLSVMVSRFSYRGDPLPPSSRLLASSSGWGLQRHTGPASCPASDRKPHTPSGHCLPPPLLGPSWMNPS